MEKLKLSDDEKKDVLKFDEILSDDGTWIASVGQYFKDKHIMREMNFDFHNKYLYFIIEHKTNGYQHLTRNEKE